MIGMNQPSPQPQKLWLSKPWWEILLNVINGLHTEPIDPSMDQIHLKLGQKCINPIVLEKYPAETEDLMWVATKILLDYVRIANDEPEEVVWVCLRGKRNGPPLSN